MASTGEKRRGEMNGRAKLTWRRVKRWRKVWKKGRPGVENPYSVLKLAERAKMSPGSMWLMLAGKTWSREPKRVAI